MSKLRSDELVNKEGTGGPNFPQGITTIDPTTDNHVATKSYVDSTVSFYGGNAISPTAPTNPTAGSFWTDTSTSPHILKVWNGKDWIEFSSDVNFTGTLNSPLEVYTPFPNDGETFNYFPTTDTIESKSESFVEGMLDQRNDTGLLRGREDYYTSGRPEGSNASSGIQDIAYGKGTYVLLTKDEGIAYSKTGGTTWERVPFPDTATYWSKVIYTGHHFGGRFVAVGYSAGKQSMWSDDGVTWNFATTLPSEGNYTDVDINPSTGRIVAAGVSPQISTYSGRSPYMYSDDGGETWTRSNRSYQNWQGTCAIAYGNGIWVSPGFSKSSPNNAKHYPEWSTDGINWNVVNNVSGTSGGTDNVIYESVVFNPEHNMFVAFGIGKIATTTDGANWTVSTISDDGVDYTQVVYGNGVYIAAGRRLPYQQQGYRITNSWSPGGTKGFSSKTMLPTKPGGDDNDASRITAMRYIDDRFVIACADGSIFLTEQELAYGTLPAFKTTKEEARFINLASPRIFKFEDETFVPNFEIYDLFDGSLPVTDIGTETEIDILSVNGTAIEVLSIDGISVGDRLKVSEPLVYGLNPDAVKFTTTNAASTIIQASDATVAFRRWTLEYRVFDVDPWTVVTVADDYSPVADQDGAIPWAEKPTLEENTQYRVKVEYHSSNAETVASEYQYFQTGDSTAGKLLYTEGIQIKNEQISILSYEQTTTGVTIRLASGSFAADFEASVGKYLEVSNSPLDVVNGFLEITSVDSGSEISGEGYITVDLAGFTPLISAGKVKSLGNVSAADPARTAGTYPGLSPTGGNGTNLKVDVTVLNSTGNVQTLGNVGAAVTTRTAGTYPGLSPTGGNGTNLEVDVTVDDNGAATVSVISGGNDYQVNDTLTLTDAVLGGGGGAPLTFDVDTIDEDGAVNVTVADGGDNYQVNDTLTLTDAVLGGGGGAPLTFDVDSLEVDLPWSSAPNADVRVKTLAVANTLGYVKLPFVIPGRFIESVTTAQEHTDAHIKLSSGLFTQEFEPSVGDLVQISDATLPPNTMDPETSALTNNSGTIVYRTISEDGLTIRNVGRPYSGKCYSAREMKPNTGTYYWEVSSTTFADDLNELPTEHASFDVALGTSWRILLKQPKTQYPETDARWQQALVYHGNSVARRDMPHYYGERVGFEYNSNNGHLKVTFDGVVIYDEVHYFLTEYARHVVIQDNEIGNEITMHFAKDSWMYAPVDPVTYATADYLQESGTGTSNANDLWEIVHINDDQVDGPTVKLYTYAYEMSLNNKHRLGAETIAEYPDQNGDSVWVYVTLPYDCTGIEFSADKGEFPGEGSRNVDNRYQPIKLYQIKVNNSIISETNYYSGTLTTDTPDMWVYRDNYAFTTHSTAWTDPAHLNGYKTYDSAHDSNIERTDSFPLGTNSDRFTELGTMIFTPGRAIPVGNQIRIKVSTGTKLTFVCGASYPPHDGGVISIRTRELFPGSPLPTLDETAITPWGADQPGTLSIGSSTLFENLANMEAANAALLADSSEDSSGDSSGGSSGSGDSSGGSSGSGDSSGGGY